MDDKMMAGDTSGGTGWQFWIDRGGTFTDIVALTPDGRIRTAKLLSEAPEFYPDAAIEGIRRMLGLPAGEAIPTAHIAAVKMGTTVATNALLERKGDRTVLVITAGFADAPRIGSQQRPRLFDLDIKLPDLVYERVVEAPGRVDVEGRELEPLDPATVEAGLRQAHADGIRACAIVAMHGYRYPGHERRIADIARKIGFTQVSASHETSPLIKLVPRADTTVVDAYLSPILRRYVDQVASELPGVRLLFMQSNGGLTDASLFQGRDSILSGPAGGIVGAARTAERAGFAEIIGFDMGGTSTDVTHYAGEFERRFETEVAGVRMRAPMMHIHTVAAGGGSICRFDGARLRVGPESAGADPGPACYRRGGPATVTDCNVVLGRIQPDRFPSVFGTNADQPIDVDASRARLAAIAAEIGDKSVEEVAEGFLRIAVDNMANAIKRISVARGYDVTRYTLVSFGGAGGQHACAVADALAIDRVLIHPLAGVLSAFGMGLAEIRAMREASIELGFDIEGLGAASGRLDALEAEAKAELESQGVEPRRVHRRLHIRYSGTDTALAVDEDVEAAMREAFLAAHQSQFGFVMEGRPLTIEAVSVEAIAGGSEADPLVEVAVGSGPAGAVGEAEAVFSGERRATSVHDRDRLAPGARIAGPAIIVERTATTVVEPGWRAEITDRLDLLLIRSEPRPARVAVGTSVDPVLLEVFNNLFMSVAEQMGTVIQNTAYSVNIKERLDYSCAVFDAEGRLVANAPHMPVHLGSMGTAVRAIIDRAGHRIGPGDVYVLNDPYAGGTHLPDLTVVTPVFVGAASRPLFWVASRGHHADIGGLTPGSMPPFSRTIEDEGVLITDFQLVGGGRFREEAFIDLLTSARYPVRNTQQNIGDIRAQIAANEKGVRELLAMIARYGLDVVEAYMGHVRANAAEQVRRVVDRIVPGRFVLPMDSGAEIRVRVDVDRQTRRAKVDFTGTSPQQPTNFNAPSAIVRAAVLYVFRTLVADDIPLNDGCLEAIDIVIPEGSMLAPMPPAAVVAGNVETSQAVTNALYGALGVLAAAQGTMNNLTFGNSRHQYYETICGGAGAGRGFDGCSAVHTHMTNSRLTDPEVLELRFPVLVESFRIRRGSGGAGRWRGGDGVVRRIRFLEPMTVAILANNRKVAPFGLEGGSPAAPGRTYVLRALGGTVELGATGQADVAPGDSVVVETPGGGGFGALDA